MIPKIIILEGCDKTGKSTLAKKLSKQLGYKVVHLGVPKPKGHFQKLEKLIQDNPDGIIFDRFHWGDRVYTGITAKKRALTPPEFFRIKQMLGRRETVVIYCHSSQILIRRRFIEDGEELIRMKEISTILNRYNQMLVMSNLEIIKYDFTKDKLPIIT